MSCPRNSLTCVSTPCLTDLPQSNPQHLSCDHRTELKTHPSSFLVASVNDGSICIVLGELTAFEMDLRSSSVFSPLALSFAMSLSISALHPKPPQRKATHEQRAPRKTES